MYRASSATCTCSASRSASENSATVAMPMLRQVRAMRTAISPRLAIRILEMRFMVQFSIAKPSVTEHAVAHRAHHLARVRNRQADAEHVAGLARIEDAVVPDARAGEER